MFKKSALLLAVLLCICFFGVDAYAGNIAICQSMQHPALDDVRKGFIKRLNSRSQDFKFRVFQNFNENDLLKKGADKAVSEIKCSDYELVFCIGTPAAVACKNRFKDKDIIFSAVTDPVQAGLVENMQISGTNMAGMSDMSPVDRQLRLIRQIQPKSRTLGMVYSRDEQNSRKIAEIMTDKCPQRGFELIKIVVKDESEIKAKLNSALKKCDALYVPTDNKVVSVLDEVVEVCLKHRVPVYTADPNSVSRGAVVALSVDYFQMGQESAEMALQVLNGTDPAEMAVRKLDNLQISLNLSTAELLDLQIPVSLILAADVIYEE
ncbi:MAG: ABC transporter substrate-binding protein [Thermodesulfobacteriota bacterium]